MLSQRRSFVLGMFLTATAGLTGCKSREAVTNAAEDPLLVRYEDQELHFSDVQENTPFSIQSQDSAQIIAQFADRWIRERMMVKEAREKLGTSAEIDALTEKFREELQVMHYEEKLVREKLDTVISDEELMSYYKNNKSKYKLESTIFRFVFVKVTKPVDDSKTLESLWKNLSSRNLQELNLFCQNNAEICFLHPEKWYKWDEVGPYLPSKFIQESTVQSGISRDFADFNFAYKIRFFEVVKPNQDPPLSFVREQATQALLHQRKLKILEQYKAELYERELKNKKIQFINK